MSGRPATSPWRRPSARSRDSVTGPTPRRWSSSARPGDRGAPSRPGCSGTTTSPVAGGPARPVPAAGLRHQPTRRTIAACIGVTSCPASPTCPATSSASSTRSRTRSATNPTGRPRPSRGPGRTAGTAANGRVEAAVHQILDGDRRGSRPAGPDRDTRARPPDVHRADRRLPRRSGAAHQRRHLRHRLQRDGRGQGHPVLLAVRAPPAAVLRDRRGRLHPEGPGHRAVEDPAHRRDVRPAAPGPGAADPADRRLPPGATRSAGRRRRARGDPPVRGHARRPQARER